MTDHTPQPHRATPEQWQRVEACAGRNWQIPWSTAPCLLELRARVEALEAAQQPPAVAEESSAAQPPAPAPAGSLVALVKNAIVDGIVKSDQAAACAAILAVAEWLRTEEFSFADAEALEREAAK